MKNPNIPGWAAVIAGFVPRDGREAAEQRSILAMIETYGDALLLRSCEQAHMTASAVIVNRARTKTLMAYHRIYQSWAWTGGHCDGEADFEAVARREAREETGVGTLRRLGGGPASIEVLPVWAHVKRGAWVGSHLHLNVSYLFEAPEDEPLRACEEENAAVAWLPIEGLNRFISEAEMLPLYDRLLKRTNDC